MENDTYLRTEADIQNMGLEQMRRERVLLSSELKSIESQISDLAFNNYGTYADAGRATHDCSKTFGQMRDKTVDLSSQAEELTTAFQEFRTKAKLLAAEQELTKKALDKSNPIWELLSLPSRMDICIRAGYYDLAYSLTNYGMQLQQQPQLYKNPLIKKVADRLVEARSYLLEELFNKFAGPLDLAESIKVVNNVRKMPYLTANQLRIAVLQHRDMYLDKQILDISGNIDMIVQAIEIYRTCMYDTLVLYLAVFPENEIIRKDPSADPRWECWPQLPPSSILSQWAISNIKRLLDLIQRADMKSAIDLSTIWSKLMTMASSFGRMGIDFRPLIVSRLTQLVENRFRQNVTTSTNKLIGSSREIVMIGIDPASLPQFENAPDAPPVPAAELSLWDDLTIYANNIVEALNGLRFILTPVVLSTVVISLRDSIRSILSWLSTSHSQSANFSRAVRIVTTCLAPFFEKCVAFFFPPSAVIKIFGSALSKQQYIQFIEFDMIQLAASCDGSTKIEEIVRPLLQKPNLADIDLENMLTKKEEPRFFLEKTPDNDDDDEQIDEESSSNKPELAVIDVKHNEQWNNEPGVVIENRSLDQQQDEPRKEEDDVTNEELNVPDVVQPSKSIEIVVPQEVEVSEEHEEPRASEKSDFVQPSSIVETSATLEPTQETEIPHIIQPLQNREAVKEEESEILEPEDVATDATQQSEEELDQTQDDEEWGWGEDADENEEEQEKEPEPELQVPETPKKKGGKDD